MKHRTLGQYGTVSEVYQELNGLKDHRDKFDKVSSLYDDAMVLLEMGYEENDTEMIPKLKKRLILC